MEVPNEWPCYQSGDNLLWPRAWLRMQNFKRSGALDGCRPVLSAAGSLYNQDRKKLNPPGETGRWQVYWPDVKCGRRPRNGRSLRADVGIAETSRLRRQDEARAPIRARDPGEGGATAVDEGYPRASTPLANGRRGWECSQSSLDYSLPGSLSYSCSRSGAEGSAEAGPSNATPRAAPAAAVFKARQPYLARAHSTRLCKMRYQDLPEDEKAREVLYKPRSRSKTNPYRRYEPREYAAALRASRERMVNEVQTLSKKPDAELSAERIYDRLSTLIQEVARDYPPVPYNKIRWVEEEVSMDVDAFTVDQSFLCALQRLDTRLQLLAHTLGYEYEHQWPAKVCVCRVETLMLINICQVQDSAYAVMNYQSDQAWRRPQTDDEDDCQEAAAAARSKSRSRKRKRRGRRGRGDSAEVLSECEEEEDQVRGEDDFVWYDLGADGRAGMTGPSDPSIEAQRGGEGGVGGEESGPRNEETSPMSATWRQRSLDLGMSTSACSDGRRRPRLSSISVEVEEGNALGGGASGHHGRRGAGVQVRPPHLAALYRQGHLWRLAFQGSGAAVT